MLNTKNGRKIVYFNFFYDKNYFKIFKNKKSKKRLCYVLDHPVICRMAFVSMFWDENWSPICMLPLGAPNPPFLGGGARQYWSDKKNTRANSSYN